nr:hypothetical protein HK105_006529 [Polyrhizophydium stewartii]
MGKKGGGKRKGKKKNAGDLPGQKFEPMPLTWPGKVSDENLFSSMAREVRAELEAQQQDRHVCLRVRQLDWDFHDFFITLPKSATIYRLQHEIAKAQHLLSHDAGHAANPASSRERKAESLEDALADEAGGAMMHASRFEALNITCDDPRSTLSSCFAEVAKFVLDTRAKPESPEPHGSDDADEPAPSAAGGDNTGTQAAPADKPARARSAGKSRAHSAGRSSRGKRSRPASAASSKSSKAPPEEPAGPVCGALSVKFMHDILPPRRPRSANLSKAVALGGGPEPEIPDAVTIYYDIRPYISKSIGKPAEEVRTIEAELESHIANLRTTFEKAALTRRQSQVPGGYLDMDSHEKQEQQHEAPKQHHFDIDCALLMREEKEWVHRTHVSSAGTAEASIMAAAAAAASSKKRFNGFAGTVKTLMRVKALSKTLHGQGHRGGRLGALAREEPVRHDISEGLSAVMQQISASLRAT